jgi:trans-2,3-dihydro-3-hydroxyanthranilate isomerase
VSDHPRQIRVVDVFTEKPLAGNQLAVVLDGRGISSELMQRIASEMNFSETTFVLPPDDASHAAKVRIFTPVGELPFAGHPTIGTAWVLAHEGVVADGAVEFVLEEKVGPVAVRRDGNSIWMTHPPASFGEVIPHARVAEALGIEVGEIVADVPAQVVTTGNPFMFVALRDTAAVDRAIHDRAGLDKLLGKHAHGLYFFAVHGTARLYSRMFAPDREDPATGSAAGPLGAFAVKYGLVERASKVSIVSEQGVKMGRHSVIHIELSYGEDATDIPSRIEVGGSVMPVLRGELL